MIKATQLSKRYDGVTALHALDLHVGRGEIFCLLGPNGAGKTTTINLFLGFLTPDGGKAEINGLEVSRHLLETKRYLAYIPEQVNLYRNLSGLENLAYFSALAGHAYSRSELLYFLIEAGLTKAAANLPVGAYSKGMRQKVGIAAALAKDARALLLDEPTSGLDPAASHEFSQSLRKLAERGVAVLMTTHDLYRAKDVASRVGIMKQGRLLTVQASGELSHADLESLYLEHVQ
jgi:ABC-2 type transport system ATP-binding protein